MHTFETVTRLQHTDAAGIVFFARFFDLAHLAFEDVLDSIGHPLPRDLANAELILPVVHASTDFRSALRLGDPVQIDVEAHEVRSRAFTLRYHFTKPDGTDVATTLISHAAVDRRSGSATTLPEDFAEALRGI